MNSVLTSGSLVSATAGSAALAMALLLAGGCGGGGGGGQPAGGTPTSKDHGHDHDHDHGHDHGADGHAHAGEGGETSMGADAHIDEEASPLGAQSIAGFAVSAIQHGTVAAGQEAHFDLSVTPEPGAAGGGRIAVVRAWIGAADAVGSMKGKADGSPEHLHVHVEAPASFSDSSKLWVELEIEGGAAAGRRSVSFDLKR